MSPHEKVDRLLAALARMPRVGLAQLPTPVHVLGNLSRELDGLDVWIKRDDLTGLEGGGNKTRKLEYLAADAIESGADMLVTAGAIQSNHTRQTAAAAARLGMKCALAHFGWTEDAGPAYRKVGNILLSSMMGAELFLDDTPRPIEDQSPLLSFFERLRAAGHRPYLIPGGASEHRLGSMGYMACAAEIVSQSAALGVHFDYVIHCTGSSSTQAGLVAGFAAMGVETKVVGVADDYETSIKRDRVTRLARDALGEIGLLATVSPGDVEVVAGDLSPYGVADDETYDAIGLLARTEGLVVDPVYEGKALRGLLSLANDGYFEGDCKVLLMHLGGSPAVHAYADKYGVPVFSRLHEEP